MTLNEAIDFIRISMIVGKSLYEVLPKRGINVARINYQDNGNWKLDTPEGPTFHLHFYGRARNSIEQKHGEATRMPLKEEFKKQSGKERLNEKDIKMLKEKILEVEKSEKFKEFLKHF